MIRLFVSVAGGAVVAHFAHKHVGPMLAGAANKLPGVGDKMAGSLAKGALAGATSIFLYRMMG